MKMLKLAALAAFLFLAGCASTGTQTPAQIAANITTGVHKVCIVVQPMLSSMQAMSDNLTAEQLAELGKAQDVTTKACTAQVPAVADASDLSKTAVPALIKLVQGSSLSQQSKDNATFALIGVQAALSVALAQ